MKIIPLLILIVILILAGWQPVLWALGGYVMGLLVAGYMVGKGEL